MSKEMREQINKFKRILTESINNIDFIFKQYPELSNIGTEEQYSNYLNTIFPSSKLKGIFYHASPNKFSQFKDPYGSGLSHIWFSEKPLKNTYGNEIYSVVLDIKNPLSEFETDNNYSKELRSYENPTNPDWVNNHHITGELPKFKYDGTIRISAISDGGDKSITVRNPKQIHILGSKQDMEGFKRYLNQSI
jgi:ADP-Ribosyltransferase in polyvalent proteins